MLRIVKGLRRAKLTSSQLGALYYFSDSAATSSPLPRHAHVGIIGGGVIGCSVAYHLAKLGVKDVVLLERHQLTSGTTWHAAGLIGQLRDTETETKLSGVYGTKLYSSLEAETGHSTGYKPCGSLTLSSCKNRTTQLNLRAAKARAFGIDAHIISPKEAQEMYPYLHIDDLHAALWLPGDGSAISSDVCQSLAAGARQNGVTIIENCTVTALPHTSSAVTSITTSLGNMTCDIVVNCAGLWARQIGLLCNTAIPLAAAEHYYIYTKPLNPLVPSLLPILRDPDAYIYYREWSGGLLMGGFEPVAKAAFPDGPPAHFPFSLLPEDWSQFDILLQGALHRTPVLETAQVKMLNGPESFTPDNQYILGLVPPLSNFYVAAGFNSSGIASAGGAGRALAEWIVNKQPTMDLWTVDIRRFGNHHNNISFLNARVSETLGLHYQITWPRRELQSGRYLRRSPLFDIHATGGAVFGNKFGWERVNYFANPVLTPAPITETTAPAMEYCYGRQAWFDAVAREVSAARQGMALFDITSFSKLLIQGRDAMSFLQQLTVSNMDVNVGRIVYTSMLNNRGGIECDCTISRLALDKYLLVSATAQTTRDFIWLTEHIHDQNVVVTDVTSAESVLSLQGPLVKQFLETLENPSIASGQAPIPTAAAAPLSSLSFSHWKYIDIGMCTVRAHRITYVGEFGVELYIPSEMTVAVYHALQQQALRSNMHITLAGYYAIESMRVEKAYRAWGHELTSDTTPLEAGLGFTIDWSKSFLGKEALLQQKQHQLNRRLVSILFKNGDDYAYGGEPVLRNGKIVGYLTSAAYGHTLNTMVGMAYINHPAIDTAFIKAGVYQVQCEDRLVDVEVMLRPPYDPKNSKVLV